MYPRSYRKLIDVIMNYRWYGTKTRLGVRRIELKW